MSNKHNLVLYIDKELVEKSREFGVYLSKTFENHLKHLINQFSKLDAIEMSAMATVKSLLTFQLEIVC